MSLFSRYIYLYTEGKVPVGNMRLNSLDKVGVWMDLNLFNMFEKWGTFCANFPIPVIVISIAIACGLCAGIHSLKVTTDPVQLWSGPNSKWLSHHEQWNGQYKLFFRSRLEKEFFDETFRPFYRTSQVIMHFKEEALEPVIHQLFPSHHQVKVEFHISDWIPWCIRSQPDLHWHV